MTALKTKGSIALISAFSSATLLLPAVMAAPPAANAQPVSRNCPGDNYVTLYTNFAELRSYLDSAYARNGRVWQAPNDEAVWRLWCGATHGSAILSNNTPIPATVMLNDGTRLDIRTDSKSGGYAIDINSLNHSRNFKVHVA